MRHHALLLVLVAPACDGSSDPADTPKPAVDAPEVEPAQTHPEAPAPAKPAARTIDWIEDDYAAARAKASSANKPILVDMWAPWCHTCLSMQQTVLRESAVTRFADDYVWLAVDTDREANAEVVGKLPMNFWPTFFVLDPKTEVVSSLAGAAGPVQFGAFLDAGLLALGEAPDAGSKAARAAAEAMAKRDWANAEKHYATAIDAAEGALKDRVPALLVDRIVALRKLERWEDCVALAEGSLGDVAAGRAASTTDFAYYGSACAEHVDDARASTLRQSLRSTLQKLAADPKAPLSIDDRSDLLANLRELTIALGQPEPAKVHAERQRKILDAAWAAASTPRERLTFAWPRAEVHDFLGSPATLIDDYRALVEAMPGEYEPPYRLAWVALQAGDAKLSRQMATQAVEHAYGPRKARVLALLADACKAEGDVAAEREARTAVVELWKGLPASMQRPKKLAAAEAALALLG